MISLTSRASRWFAIPAATIGRTGTPARSASKVTNASCSTCWSRPNPRLRCSPRRHSRRPDRREELAVPGIPAVDLEQQCVTVRGRCEDERHTARFERRVTEVRRRDAQIAEGGRDLVEREPSGGGAEDEVHDRGRAQPDQEAGDHADRERHAQCDAGHGSERHDPPTDEPQWAAHVRRGHDDHGRRDRQPDREVDRGGSLRAQGFEARGPVRSRDPSREHREPEGQAPGDQLGEEQSFPPACEEREKQEDQRPSDHQVVADLPEPAEQTGKLVHQVGDGLVDRGRSGGEEGKDHDAEHGEQQQDDVGGAPGLRGVARRREDPHVGVFERSWVEPGQTSTAPGPRSLLTLRRRPRRSHSPLAPPVGQASRCRLPRPFCRSDSRRVALSVSDREYRPGTRGCRDVDGRRRRDRRA